MYYRISKIQIYRYTMMCIRTNIMIEFLGQLGQERWSTRDSTTPMTPCLSNKKICKEQMFTYKHISSYHILSLCIKFMVQQRWATSVQPVSTHYPSELKNLIMLDFRFTPGGFHTLGERKREFQQFQKHTCWISRRLPRVPMCLRP